MTNIKVHEWGYINTKKGGVQQRFSVIASASKALWWFWVGIVSRSTFSTELKRVVISIWLEQSSTATIGQWRVCNLGTQGRMHSLKRKWFFTGPCFPHHFAPFSTVLAICLSGVARPYSFHLAFTAVVSLQPSRCHAAGVALGAKHSHSSALQS